MLNAEVFHTGGMVRIRKTKERPSSSVESLMFILGKHWLAYVFFDGRFDDGNPWCSSVHSHVRFSSANEATGAVCDYLGITPEFPVGFFASLDNKHPGVLVAAVFCVENYHDALSAFYLVRSAFHNYGPSDRKNKFESPREFIELTLAEMKRGERLDRQKQMFEQVFKQTARNEGSIKCQ